MRNSTSPSTPAVPASIFLGVMDAMANLKGLERQVFSTTYLGDVEETPDEACQRTCERLGIDQETYRNALAVGLRRVRGDHRARSASVVSESTS